MSDIRLKVWLGQRLKTNGPNGLFKKDLIKNSKGRIVSKRKSEQARALNNLKLGKPKKRKLRPKTKSINPITGQERSDKGLTEVSIDNILLNKRKQKAKKAPKAPKMKPKKLTLGERLKLKKMSKK